MEWCGRRRDGACCLPRGHGGWPGRTVADAKIDRWVTNWGLEWRAFETHSPGLIYDRRDAGRKVLTNGLLVAAVLSAVGMLFSFVPVDVESTQFTHDYARAPYITAYWLTYLAGVNYLLIGLVRLVGRYARLCTQDWLRLGLQLVAAGGVFGIAYWCHWAAYLLLRKADVATPTSLDVIGYLTAPAAVILVVVGSTLPAIGPRTHLPSPSAWRRDYSTYRKLYPLWRDLTSAVPESCCTSADGGKSPTPSGCATCRTAYTGGWLRFSTASSSSITLGTGGSRRACRRLRRRCGNENQQNLAAIRRRPARRPAYCRVHRTGIRSSRYLQRGRMARAGRRGLRQDLPGAHGGADR